MRTVITALLLLPLIAGSAGANSFSAEGTGIEPTYGYEFRDGRWLINDGSFEDGTCYDGNSAWTCASDNDCDWIADLVPLGLWNYDGTHVAWLGGFCGGAATCTTSICQEVILDFGCLTWWWMAYVVDEVMNVSVTVDDWLLFEHSLTMYDHLLDYQLQLIAVPTDGQPHTICFNMDNPGCLDNLGDNYFIDYVGEIYITSIEEVSYSTVKASY